MPIAVPADRCPGVLRPHDAADGSLARIRVPGGRLTPPQLETIAALAAELGSGIIELTSRAGVQVRGLAAGDEAACARRLADAGLLPSITHERARNILASPVAGRHPASVPGTDAIVAALDAALCADPALAALGGRFLFAVRDGSPTLDVSRADIVLEPGDDPVDALHAARAGRPLRPANDDGLRSELTPGTLTQNDGRCAVTAAVPLGRLHPDALDALAALARAHATDVRIAPERTVTLVDLSPTSAPAVAAQLAGLGLPTAPSGWDGLSACAGLGHCTRARADVRTLAARRALQRTANAPAEHWAACERGCGRPPDARLELRT